MADYEFTTVWRIDAPLESVWDEIRKPAQWPAWWRGLERLVELEPGDENGVGSVQRYVWKGALPYRLTLDIRITRAEPMSSMEGAVSGGLTGLGRWRFTREGGQTVVHFDWLVSGPRPWMRFLAPLARPLFRWNHNGVMEQGRLGLIQRIATLPVAAEQQAPAYRSTPPREPEQ